MHSAHARQPRRSSACPVRGRYVFQTGSYCYSAMTLVPLTLEEKASSFLSRRKVSYLNREFCRLQCQRRYFLDVSTGCHHFAQEGLLGSLRRSGLPFHLPFGLKTPRFREPAAGFVKPPLTVLGGSLLHCFSDTYKSYERSSRQHPSRQAR